MTEFITTLAVGILVSVLGIINMTGNISSLHRYHRHRVSEENKKPFGRLVGLGTLIVGVALMVFDGLMFVFEQTALQIILVIAPIILIAGVVVGLAISFYAMKKYNGGIF